MEINLDNAFLTVVKISLGPFLGSIDAVSHKLQKTSLNFLHRILEKPLLSTLLCTCVLAVLLSILTMSIIITITVFCLVIVVIIFEGFVLAMILILATGVTTFSACFLILLLGVKSKYDKGQLK